MGVLAAFAGDQHLLCVSPFGFGQCWYCWKALGRDKSRLQRRYVNQVSRGQLKGSRCLNGLPTPLTRSKSTTKSRACFHTCIEYTHSYKEMLTAATSMPVSPTYQQREHRPPSTPKYERSNDPIAAAATLLPQHLVTRARNLFDILVQSHAVM